MTNSAIAHVRIHAGSPKRYEIHNLEDHLLNTAKLAQQFSQMLGTESMPWAFLAGLWHDLGKYSPAFQARIKQVSGYYDETAHLEGFAGCVNHSSAGAIHARTLLGDTIGKVLGYLIAGHHSGLPDWDQELDRRLHLDHPFNQALYQAAIQEEIPASITNPQAVADQLFLPQAASPQQHVLAASFWIRMLFSCLVDADFLDTEQFMNPERNRQRNPLQLSDLAPVLDAHLSQLRKNSLSTPVNQMRQNLLSACLQQAVESLGIYTLTAPTGAGKTLSSLAWAFAHALKHQQERIIYVLPYTSILEQTADLFKSIFSTVSRHCVIEHHSAFDATYETMESRLAAENWDAPIIVTTNVQFLESLFANKPSRCRKLHRIANSVVILDEAQQIQPAFKAAIEGAITLLAEHYHTSILLSTATQPTLNLPVKGELAPNLDTLHAQLKRVDIQLPLSLTRPIAWEDLATELSQFNRVLCIVNRRADAQHLYSLMPHGTYHLSALMCPAHRAQVLKTIKEKLSKQDAGPVRVICTPVIEAGVDIDFPVVYRALSGLDTIAQAAGRCNREGKLPMGQMKVFVPPSSSPVGYLRKATQVARLILHGQSQITLTPELMRQYFQQLYGTFNHEDAHGILKLLKPQDGKPHFEFRTAARTFKLLGKQDEKTIYIPWDEHACQLLDQSKDTGPNRQLVRQLQRYAISLPQSQFKRLDDKNALREIHSGIIQLRNLTCYSSQIGLF